MKRKLALLICMIMVLSCISLTACSFGGDQDLSDSKYVGTWKLSSLSFQDDSEAFEEDYTLILTGDGKGQFIDEEGESNITWSLTNDGFKTKGDTKLTFTDDGENIKTKVIGVELIFEKQP